MRESEPETWRRVRLSGIVVQPGREGLKGAVKEPRPGRQSSDLRLEVASGCAQPGATPAPALPAPAGRKRRPEGQKPGPGGTWGPGRPLRRPPTPGAPSGIDTPA